MKELFKRYFIPHEGNDYQPDLLQKGAALGILTLLLLTFAVTNIQSILLISSDTFSSAILPAVLIDLTNDNRENGSLSELSHSALLDQAARLKAEDMAAKSYFSHQSPGGETPWYWFERVGYEYAYAGENLAVHFSDSDKVVDAWMRSPGHRANIMSGNYTEIGIGTARGEYKGTPTVFVVQLFGRPITAEERTQVAKLALETPAEFPEIPDRRVEGEATTVGETEAPAEAPIPLQEEAPIPEPEPADTPEIVGPPAPAVPPLQPSVEEGVHQPLDGSFELSEIATTSQLVENGIIRPLGPDVPQQSGGGGSGVTDFLKQIAGRPNAVLLFVYSIVALMVYMAVLASIVIEARRQHPVQALYGAGLLVVIWVVVTVHSQLLSGAVIL